MAATSTQMLLNGSGMVVNAYHDAEGRGDYFPGSSGTTEGQFLFILGCLEAYEATRDPKARELAEFALQNVLKVIYRNGRVPDQVTETEIFAPHWLFNVKYPFTSARVHMDRHYYFEPTSEPFGASRAWIPASDGRFRTLFNVRSMDSEYLWDNPYSALKAGHFFTVTDVHVSENETFVYIAESLTGDAYVTYSTLTGPQIEINEPFEAWPDWRKLEPGEIDCAVDVFIWARRAFDIAYHVLGNDTWRKARDASDQQAAIAMDINDSRDWIRPTFTGNPFAVGSSFSHQDRFPAASFTTDSDGRVLIIAQQAADPSHTTVQYGNADRQDVYQNDDRTHVEIGADRQMQVRMFIDQQQQYADARRYYADILLSGGGIQNLTLSRIQFKNSAGQELPVNSPVYTFGIETYEREAFNLTIGRVRQSPPRDVMYYPGAIPFTANFLGNPATLIDWRGPVYAGYQSPPMWMHTGNQPAAETCSRLLRDAQLQWKAQTGQPNTGPFAPVFYFNRDDAVQYGPPNTFGWEGPDPNTKWGGYQYRPLVELAEALRLVGAGSGLEGLLKDTINDFLRWLAQDWIWHPEYHQHVQYAAGVFARAAALDYTQLTVTPNFVRAWARVVAGAAALERVPLDYNDTGLHFPYVPFVDFPDRPPLGPPTDFPKGAAEINYPEPHMAALIMRTVILIDKRDRPGGQSSGEMPIERRAVMSKCMGLFDRLYVEEGPMAGTFCHNIEDREWFGFWHGEILSTLSQGIEWGDGPAARPSVAAKCRYWLNGMLTWAKEQIHHPTSRWGNALWPFPANWASGVEEEFIFDTEVWDAFSGREQRMSRRVVPRRRLTVTHGLAADQSQAFEAILRDRQNRPALVPQWHLSATVSLEALIGADTIELSGSMDGLVAWGSEVAISHGSRFELLQVSRVEGNQLVLPFGLNTGWPQGTRIYPVYNGLLEGDLSSTRLTGSVTQARVSFLMLPQEDLRSLPEGAPKQTFSVGNDNREVVTIRPNWVTTPTVANSWKTEMVMYADGPLEPSLSADQGRRLIEARWSLLNLEAVDEYLRLLHRLKGRRVACWLPSWVDDFVPTQAVTVGNRLVVRANEHTRIGTTEDPAVAIAVRTIDGRLRTARVSSISTIGTEAVLQLDRSILTGAPLALSDIAQVSLMYRVRQASDSAVLAWHTNRVADATVSFITVAGETE